MEAQVQAQPPAPETSDSTARSGLAGPPPKEIRVLTGIANAAFFFGVAYVGREAADEGKVALGFGVGIAGALILSWLFGRLVNGIAAAVTRERIERPPAAWMYPIDEAVHKVRQYAGLALLAGVVGLVLGALGV